jgi:hypothetical protein
MLISLVSSRLVSSRLVSSRLVSSRLVSSRLFFSFHSLLLSFVSRGCHEVCDDDDDDDDDDDLARTEQAFRVACFCLALSS